MSRLRRPSLIESALQFALLPFLALFVYDFAVALGAQSCQVRPAASNCFPWGAEATGGLWHYASKEAYMTSNILQLAVLAAAICAPFWTSGPRRGALSLIVVAAIGTLAIQAVGILI